MRMQLAILCLCAASVVVTAESNGGHLCKPCRQHLGVYYITITYAPNVTSSDVVTYHTDGTFDAIDSAANGNPPPSTPVIPAYSDLKGVWKCNGANGLEANAVFFFYPTESIPGSFTTNTAKVQFDGNGGVSGTIITTLFDLASTRNQNTSKWVKIAGPFQYTLKGYKLFNICDNYSS